MTRMTPMMLPMRIKFSWSVNLLEALVDCIHDPVYEPERISISEFLCQNDGFVDRHVRRNFFAVEKSVDRHVQDRTVEYFKIFDFSGCKKFTDNGFDFCNRIDCTVNNLFGILSCFGVISMSESRAKFLIFSLGSLRRLY